MLGGCLLGWRDGLVRQNSLHWWGRWLGDDLDPLRNGRQTLPSFALQFLVGFRSYLSNRLDRFARGLI